VHGPPPQRWKESAVRVKERRGERGMKRDGDGTSGRRRGEETEIKTAQHNFIITIK